MLSQKREYNELNDACVCAIRNDKSKKKNKKTSNDSFNQSVSLKDMTHKLRCVRERTCDRVTNKSYIVYDKSVGKMKRKPVR